MTLAEKMKTWQRVFCPAHVAVLPIDRSVIEIVVALTRRLAGESRRP
jgi:hypothetical protein